MGFKINTREGCRVFEEVERGSGVPAASRVVYHHRHSDTVSKEVLNWKAPGPDMVQGFG